MGEVGGDGWDPDFAVSGARIPGLPDWLRKCTPIAIGGAADGGGGAPGDGTSAPGCVGGADDGGGGCPRTRERSPRRGELRPRRRERRPRPAQLRPRRDQRR